PSCKIFAIFSAIANIPTCEKLLVIFAIELDIEGHPSKINCDTPAGADFFKYFLTLVRFNLKFLNSLGRKNQRIALEKIDKEKTMKALSKLNTMVFRIIIRANVPLIKAGNVLSNIK